MIEDKWKLCYQDFLKKHNTTTRQIVCMQAAT